MLCTWWLEASVKNIIFHALSLCSSLRWSLFLGISKLCVFFFNLHLFYSFIFVFLKICVDADCKSEKGTFLLSPLWFVWAFFFFFWIYKWILLIFGVYIPAPCELPCSFWRWEFTHCLTKFDESLQYPGLNTEPWGCSCDRMGKVSTIMKLTVPGWEGPIKK